MTEFGDSAEWRNIPADLAAVLPIDGNFAAPPAAAARFPRVRWYTVTGDYRHAGAIDWELGNPCFNAGSLRRFVRGRRAMGVRARVYVDRADAREALDALGPGLLSYAALLWWIPTLDGKRWTADELAGDLAANWDAPIPAGQLWANQYVTMTPAGPVTEMPRQARIREARAGGAYDVSTLFERW